MANPVKVYDAFFENDNADNIFYYTGKSNVLGLQAPDYVLHNEKKLANVRLAYITIPNMGDPELVTRVMEDFSVSLVSEIHDGERNALQGHHRLQLFAGYKDDIVSDPILLHTDCMDPFNYSKLSNIIFATSIEEYEEDGISKDAVSVWALGCEEYEYICIHVNKSLSASLAPINGDSFFPSSYYIEYINDENVVVDTNITNGSINGAYKADKMEEEFGKRVEKLEENLTNNIPIYKQTAVVYDAEYTPANTNENTLKPTSLKQSKSVYDYYSGLALQDIKSSVYLDTTNKSIKTNYSGEYSLQVKNGFYLIQGESRVDINVYIDNVKDEELSMSMYLTSNNEEDARKAIKNTFSSPLVYKYLSSDIYIRVDVVFTNIDNIVVENETELLVTLIQRNYEEINE